MKLLLAFTFTLLNINFGFLPQPDLLLIMGISMIIDFATGYSKAIMLKEKRTSSGLRKTIIKFIQYGGALVIGMLLSYLSQNVQATKSWTVLSKYTNWFNSGLLIFIIFIEIVSILENMLAIDSTSPFSRYIIKPLLKVLTLQLKANSLETETENDKEEK
ncbi:MAG: phage holin family protein [Ferruginibacter sp.]